jgi:hypothetical protein
MISIAVIPLAFVVSAADPQGLHDSHSSHGEPAAMTGALGAYPMSRDSSGNA